jgi:hypothetical protein
VVGQLNTSSLAPCSGVFVLQGIPLPGFVPTGSAPFSAGLRHDLDFEAMECSSVGVTNPQGGTGTVSEWVIDPVMNHKPQNTWTALVLQTALICNTTGASSPWSVGSMERAAGTIIDLGTFRHNGNPGIIDAAIRPLAPLRAPGWFSSHQQRGPPREHHLSNRVG